MEPQTYTAQVVRSASPEELAEWYEKRGITPDSEGRFNDLPYRGEDPAVEREAILEQVKINAARHDVPNLRPREYTPKTMVYLGGGITLQDHLDEIKRKCEDPNYDVFTSNKTCKWLLGKGIKPNFHLILDPQQKKLKDLDYEESIPLVLGIQCHPDLFEYAKAKGRSVEKFLAISVKEENGRWRDVEITHEAMKDGDRELVCISGGSMCGTRMIYFAGARGYRRLEYYGFDGNVSIENNVLRCYSYQKFRGENVLVTECEDGRKFHTTMSLARQAEELVSLYNEYPGLDIEIYGDSLLAHTLKLYRERVRHEADYRITPQYKEMLAAYHKNANLGVMGGDSAPRVFMAAAQLAKKNGSCRVLDYGAGRGLLVGAIRRAFPDVAGITYSEYDPAVERLSADPEPADLVFCGDVMEHVEPECVNAVCEHIANLTRKVAIFIIGMAPAQKSLPDGRNAHICLKSQGWWLSYLRKHFVVIEKQRTPDTLIAVCQPLP